MTASAVLVTGAGQFLGARVAAALAREPGVDRVVGVDSVPPSGDAGRVEYVLAGDPQVSRILAEVDAVVHLGDWAVPPTVAGTPNGTAPGRAAPDDTGPEDTGPDETGTLRLLTACRHSVRLRVLVVRSTAAVYPASSRDPAVFVESDAGGVRPARDARAWPRSATGRTATLVEAHADAFARDRPDTAVTVLRLVNLIGPTVPTRFADYLWPPAVPTPWGRDPRLQFVHEDDAVEVFRLAVLSGRRPADHAEAAPAGGPPVGAAWPVNVAGSGVLLLSQVVRRAGRLPVPVPGPAGGLLAGLSRRLGPGVGVRVESDPGASGLLVEGVVDTTRLRLDLGYQPRHTSAEAFDAFLRGQLRTLGRRSDG